MTQEEAKLLLSVTRETAPDPDDQELVAALKMLDNDPELRDWYEREQRCISALDAKLAGIAPPPDLRASILSAHRRPPRAERRRWYRRPAILGIAALVLLSLLGGMLWLNRPFASGGSSLSAYERDMATFLDRFFLLDFESEKIDEITAWLASRRGVDDFRIPAALADHPSLGCEVIPWQGRVSYLICFDVEGVLFHLFLLPGGSDLPSESDQSGKYRLDAKWAAAAWTDGNDLYFCCSLADETEFRRVLGRPRRATGA